MNINEHFKFAGFSLFFLLTSCGTQTPAPLPILPATSGIPGGIYTGTIDISTTVWVNGSPTTEMQSQPFSIVIDQEGRLLDKDGNPFMINGTYFLDVGVLKFTAFLRSVTATESQILLQFDLEVDADVGTATGEFSGVQTDTLTYQSNDGSIEFIRSQTYGGVGSDDAVISVLVSGTATLNTN